MQYGYFHPIKFIALGSTKNQVKFIYYSMSLFFTLFLSSTMAKAPGRQQRARELYLDSAMRKLITVPSRPAMMLGD